MTCTGLTPTSTDIAGALDELTAAADAAQLAQADAWCAAAAEQLHQAILDVQRATARRDAARAALAQYIARAADRCLPPQYREAV